MGFAADLKRIADKNKQTLEQVYRVIMNDMANSMILMSPVDEGTFKANWLADVGKADFSFNATRTNVEYVNGRLTAKLSELTTQQDFFFTNSMPYAERLENGYSDFAPNGMVKVTINNFQSIAEFRINQARR